MNKEYIFNVIKESFEEIIPDISVENITVKDSLKELGANSIDRMEIILISMEAIGVKLPMLKFGQAKNIEDIIEILYQEKCKAK